MPPKRKRRVSISSKGLAPGEQLKRSALPGNSSSRWSWVGTEVLSVSGITPEHLLISCGLSKRNNNPFCPNKYLPSYQRVAATHPVHNPTHTGGELDDDIIIISDDEGPPCSAKNCKFNPNCLNYLRQEDWEDEDDASEAFLKATVVEENPTLNTRESNFPVGLKNLGATCYANASLQVWFRDLTFRSGVYQCVPSDSSISKYKESPIFQLQVTFSALQESIQNCFNPIKLVESLHLRTSEQQDAQEFSKLFMSHLDVEFKKQANPRVKSLVTDQFQGTQVYGTICNRCKYRSERASDFLEIEINLKNNAKLEDRIEAVLQPEILSGDNQYFCSQCESLQNATRYTELKELPPVLHFSLLRFVYDITTMERKKSKHSASFPKTLDMAPFMMSRGEGPSSGIHASADNVYELRGVLLHKGPSAYHGHYEAQVFDETKKSWYQFNDENVTRIKALGDKSRIKPIVVGDDDDPNEKSQNRKNRTNARKRRRVESGDESDFQLVVAGEKMHSEYISSKDAYMLIYARRTKSVSSHSCDTRMDIPRPPSDALEFVNALNASHGEACESYDKKATLIKARFLERRRRVVNIYRAWHTDAMDQDTVLVSRQALSEWLSQHQGKSALSIAAGESDGKHVERITLEDITCVHGAVDPNKANCIKRIKRSTYLDIVNDTGWEFGPSLTVSDICVECVQRSFQERLYHIEHPQAVVRFDRISEVAFDCTGFWISKPWIRDWRLSKPKMHVESEGDPAPDAASYVSDVICEHGALSLNTTSRRRISVEAAELLQELYPSWSPLSTDSETCPVCDANVHTSRESKREIRKQAEDEKAKLKNLHDYLLSEEVEVAYDAPCALIPISFAKTWKKWLNHPTDYPRPERVDNTFFICEHDMLVFDPNVPTELEASAVLVPKADWDILESTYPAGPLISITKSFQDGGPSNVYTHTHMVCTDCRMQRKTEWTTTQITIQMSGARSKINGLKGSKKGATYSSYGARQSRRLRQIKELGEKRQFTVSKLTTIKEIKVMIQGELEIPTICQRLFHDDKELENNEANLGSLRICADDVLELRLENEVVVINSDSEDETRPRVEERGFHGTLLGNSSSPSPASPSPECGPGEGKYCRACTFSNESDALECVVCDTVFI